MNLALYLYQRIADAEDVREVIKQDFLRLSSKYDEDDVLINKEIWYYKWDYNYSILITRQSKFFKRKIKINEGL